MSVSVCRYSIREVVTRKFIRFLEEQMTADAAKYDEFFAEYAYFLKEGVCSDSKFAEQIAKLLKFESSTLEAGKITSLGAQA